MNFRVLLLMPLLVLTSGLRGTNAQPQTQNAPQANLGVCQICQEGFDNTHPAFCLHGQCNFHKKCIASYATDKNNPNPGIHTIRPTPGTMSFECPICRSTQTHIGHQTAGPNGTGAIDDYPLYLESLSVPNPGPLVTHNGHRMHADCLNSWIEGKTEENWADNEELRYPCPHCKKKASVDCSTNCPLCTLPFTQTDPAVVFNHGNNPNVVETSNKVHRFHQSCINNFQQKNTSEFDDQIDSFDAQLKKADKDILLLTPRALTNASVKKLLERAKENKKNATSAIQKLQIEKQQAQFNCPLCNRIQQKRKDILASFDGPFYTNASEVLEIALKIGSDLPRNRGVSQPVGGPFINQLSQRIIAGPSAIFHYVVGWNQWNVSELKNDYFAHLASFAVGLLYPYSLCSASTENPTMLKSRATRYMLKSATLAALLMGVSSAAVASRMSDLGASRSTLALQSLSAMGKGAGTSLKFSLSPIILSYYLSGSWWKQLAGIPLLLNVGLTVCGSEPNESTTNAYGYGSLVGALAGLAVRYKEPLQKLAATGLLTFNNWKNPANVALVGNSLSIVPTVKVAA